MRSICLQLHGSNKVIVQESELAKQDEERKRLENDVTKFVEKS